MADPASARLRWSPPGSVTRRLDVHIEARPAAIWRRVIAACLDAGASFGAAFLIGSAISGVLGGVDPTIGELLAWAVVGAFVWQYHVRQPIRYGGTPAMRRLGLRVINAGVPAPISSRQAVLRFALCALLTWPVLFGLLIARFDRCRRGWHDRLAGTVVVAR